MSRHEDETPQTTARDVPAERRDAVDVGSTSSSDLEGDRHDRPGDRDDTGHPGVKHDPALQDAERLARLGNEEEKPADDRYGD